MERTEAKRALEAILFASNKAVLVDELKEILGEVEPREIRALAEELKTEYAQEHRSFTILEVAGGFQMVTQALYASWVRKLYKPRTERLSGPSLETLAIIAYRQPITRSEIEFIRGVNIEGVLHTLLERGLIRLIGRKEAVGRPILYGTTRQFLEHFGLKALEELPRLPEFTEQDIQLPEGMKEVTGPADESPADPQTD